MIVTAHEAFGHLAERYGLRQEGVAGLSPDAEPDAKRLGQLTDLVKRHGVTIVFTEELVSPRIADTLAREAGVETETLNPLEGLTDRELAAATTTSASWTRTSRSCTCARVHLSGSQTDGRSVTTFDGLGHSHKAATNGKPLFDARFTVNGPRSAVRVRPSVGW